jgi:uncharacterized protein
LPRVIAILGDTHMPKGKRRLPDRCAEFLVEAELIVHTGDFSAASVLADLESIGPPVVAVHGNVDEPALRRRLPESVEFEVAEGVLVGMVHDAGPARGRLERMRVRFPDCAAVIFGHSHLPLREEGPEGFQIFNPGSPTERRRAPRRSMGLGRVERGRLVLEHAWL